MLLKCIAIDDEPPALQVIKQHAAKRPELQLLQVFDDAIAAQQFITNTPVDIIFVDINMPDITGLELVRTLPYKPMIIFTTAYKNFAYEGFELEATDYLLKPISFERFNKAVQKAIDYYNYKINAAITDEAHYFFVRSEYKMLKIYFADVTYMEGLEDYIKIHLLNERPLLTLMTMKAMLEKLPPERFKRIHRSYIIAVDKVKTITGKKVVLADGKELPVSDTYIGFIRDWYNK